MKQILILALTVAYATSACLDATVLANLGFTSTIAVSVESSPSVCTDLFSTVGTCVPDSVMEAKMKSDNDNVSASLGVMVDIFGAGASLQATLLGSASATSSQISAAKASLNAEVSACVQAWSTIQQGVTCYLASGDASSHTTVSGSTVSVTVSSSTVGPLLAACVPVFESICGFTTDVTINDSASLTVDSFKTGASISSNSSLTAACTTLAANSDCSTTACTQAQYDVIINSFFAPYDYSTFPSATVAASITTAITSANTDLQAAIKAGSYTSTSTSTSTSATTSATSATNAATSATSSTSATSTRRLAGSSTVKTQSSSTSGADAAAHGNSSGVDKATASISVYALTGLIVAFITAFTI